VGFVTIRDSYNIEEYRNVGNIRASTGRDKMQTFDTLGTLNVAQAPVPMSQFNTSELREWAKITESNLRHAEAVLDAAAPGDKWAMQNWTDALNQHHAVIQALVV
jgi:hypothetical protein